MISSVLVLLLVLAVPAAAGPRKIIVAHRGASGYLPEHTLEAVAMAYAMGADYLEQDVVLSRDGVPMVLHDIYIDTVTQRLTKNPLQDCRDFHVSTDLCLSVLIFVPQIFARGNRNPPWTLNIQLVVSFGANRISILPKSRLIAV
jgi:glycerophosphoryl diester phosphodiesterase